MGAGSMEEEQQYMILDGEAYDLSRLRGRHPGGDVVKLQCPMQSCAKLGGNVQHQKLPRREMRGRGKLHARRMRVVVEKRKTKSSCARARCVLVSSASGRHPKERTRRPVGTG